MRSFLEQNRSVIVARERLHNQCHLLQVPQAVKMASFRKAALIRLSQALQEALTTIQSSRDALLQAAQQANRVAMSQQVRRQMAVVMDVVSIVHRSSASAAQANAS